MLYFFAIFSIVLGVFCAIFGILYGQLANDLSQFERIVAHVLWIFPFITASSIFKEIKRKARYQDMIHNSPVSKDEELPVSDHRPTSEINTNLS